MGKKLRMWQMIKLAESGALAEVLAVKTKLKNVEYLTSLSEEVQKSFKHFNEVKNSYILAHAPETKMIDRDSQLFVEFQEEISQLVREEIDFEKPESYIFTADGLDEKNVELTPNQASVLKSVGILDINIRVPEDEIEAAEEKEKEEKEKEEKEVKEEEVKITDTPVNPEEKTTDPA